MSNINSIKIIRLATILVVLVIASVVPVLANDDLQRPVLPTGCSAIDAPEGNILVLHTYAIGVQIYRWNGAAWDFVAPSATLFDPYSEIVGNHFAGPTWMNNDGSSVIAARVDGCTPDPSAIPWLLLRKTRTDGDGLFSRISFIQRVSTTGGLVPSSPGFSTGVIARVPYTAEYYFYAAESIGR